MFSAGFRPFFFLASLWSAVAIPVWLYAYAGHGAPPSALPPLLWHVHEMVFGFGMAAVAGFLLTAIPNWTGRLPLRGAPLAALALLWLCGRVALLASEWTGAATAAAIDLAFPAALIAIVARELIAGRNWRNLPMIAALALLFTGSLLVHLHALGAAYTGQLGNRLGLATLLMLIALVGGRIVPSFTRNWLATQGARGAMPVQDIAVDAVALLATLAALASWVAAPHSDAAAWLALLAGAALAVRLSRWRGLRTWREPMLLVLHAGYGWLAAGLLLLGANTLAHVLQPAAALHALSMGAVGTMTLAVMTRATLGHSGLPIRADSATTAVYVLVTVATLARLAAPAGGFYGAALTLCAGACWSAAFGLFVIRYFGVLTGTRSFVDQDQKIVRVNS